MKRVYITIGCSGAGKSTYINKEFTQGNSVILSSDETRLELFGTLDCQTEENHKKVFSLMRDRLVDFLLNSNKENLVYDATNLNRKKRKALYSLIKEKDKSAQVISLVFLRPLSKLIEQNNKRTGLARVSEEVIKAQYKSLQVPRLFVDYDKIKVACGAFQEFTEEFSNDISHDSSYHQETVQEHILWCMENAKLTGDEQLVEIAKYHDLGKFICKEFNEQTGYANFKGHELVSAMYYLAEIAVNINLDYEIFGSDISEKTKEKLENLEVIYQHMNGHTGITDKMKKRNKLTEKELSLIKQFTEIDDKSRRLL